MTAEIAILNKSAVALAADSAVTISAGSSQEKIYDSADKLFELSLHDSIGVMVNGDMNFMQAPLGILVKKFRAHCDRFARVTEAADSFLLYLADFGVKAPPSIKFASVGAAVRRPFETIKKRASDGLIQRLTNTEDGEAGEDWNAKLLRVQSENLSEQIAVMSTALSKLTDAEFTGAGDFEPTAGDVVAIEATIASVFGEIDEDKKVELRTVGLLTLQKAGTGPTSTGVIVAGFGHEDLFPTMVPFEVNGIVGDRLKFSRGDVVDIDREGTKAKVVPFAQREMVERFLYGLDDGIRRNITNFCKSAVPEIRKKILDHLDMSPEDAAALEASAEQAERAFFDGLASDSFEAIRGQSQTEIEDMVEFMPKPEMARMAEALVNLTSIKRRVSRGVETVGGPIDVAVISQAEGFVWVRRKHYFPGELNNRFFERKRVETTAN